MREVKVLVACTCYFLHCVSSRDHMMALQFIFFHQQKLQKSISIILDVYSFCLSLWRIGTITPACVHRLYSAEDFRPFLLKQVCVSRA
jgi:hypothetical protein